VAERVRLGAEVMGWFREEEEVSEYLGAFGAVAHWYLTPGGRFFLKGGFGHALYRISDGDEVLTSSGFGPILGVGYDLNLGGTISIVPQFNSIITLPIGNLHLDGDQQAEGVSLALLQVGLGLTWH
jgi:hypothetical protein